MKFEPLEPMSIVKPLFFFITVNKFEYEDEIQYNPAICIVGASFETFEDDQTEQKDHAITILSSVYDTDIDEAIKQVLKVCLLVAPGYKEDITLISSGEPSKVYYRNVSSFLDEMDAEKFMLLVEPPKYLH